MITGDLKRLGRGDTIKINFCRAFICVLFILLPHEPAFPSQEYSRDIGPATVVAPQALTERERAGLDKQYQFEVRGKDKLLIPSTGSPLARPDGSFLSAINGEEYRRYLGTAIDLYKADQLEESQKVLVYLNELDPGDDYVRSYLSRVRRDLKSQDAKWKNKALSEASSMKKAKIGRLLREGMDFYESKDFDSALVRFYDVLALSPDNRAALSCTRKLKAYYAKKMKAEEIVNNWSSGKPPKGRQSSLERSADMMLDEKSAPGDLAADNMLNETQVKKLVFNRKAEDLLEEVSFGAEVEAIVSAKRTEESRANQMILGVGDVLKIFVMNHPELSDQVVVQSNGDVSLPLVGDLIGTLGLTVDELSLKVVHALDRYIEKPHVSVYLVQSRSQIFYMIDEVSCTPYPIIRPDFTIRDALFLSDWGDARALGRVIVIRPSIGKPIIKKVDAFNIIFRGDLRDNIRVLNGDVIYVPLTVMAKTSKTIYDAMSPISAGVSARDQFLNTKWNKRDYKEFFKVPDDYEHASQSAKDAGYLANSNFANYAYLNLGR